MYSIETLEKSSIEELTEVFNLSFSDYLLPFSLTTEQLESKMTRDGVDPGLSVGAYLDGKLVGFILHGVGLVQGEMWCYNSGTGVIPQARGERLTTRLYDFIIPQLRNKGVTGIKLEVLSNNLRALKSYERIGFSRSRDLLCFKGSVANCENGGDLRVEELRNYDFPLFESFWDISPSWQNSMLAVNNSLSKVVLLAAYGDHPSPLGYIIYNPESRQIIQLAVNKAFRRRGIGSQLVGSICSRYGGELSIVNVDGSSTVSLDFIHHLGLEGTVRQYEMAMSI